MEAAGLVVGIVPLVVGALKCYHAVHQYLRVFRQYNPEIRRLFDRLEVQRCILENEVDLVLRKARLCEEQTPSVSATELLNQYDSAGMVQGDSSLDDALDKSLGKHVGAFKKLFIGITEQLQELQRELRCFEAVRAEQAKGESLKQTVLRVKARVKIGFDKRRLRELLDALRNDNEDLRSIASYLVDDSSYLVDDSKPSSYRSEVRTMPAEILRNRAVILALHESLTTYWTCIDPEHGGHLVKLCLRPVSDTYDPQPSEVRMDLAVACLAKVSLNAQQSLVSNPIWLYVRTTTEISCIAGASSNSTTRQVDLVSPGASGRALINHNSVCESLSKCNCNGKSSEACLSFLQPTSGFQHLFYHHETSALGTQSSACSVSLAEVAPEIRTELTIEQQFALARRLALSVLELYKSPWLPERWRINDFSSFAKPSMEDSDFAQMLHVTTTISGSAHPSIAALDLHWALADPNRSHDTGGFHAMTNSTLFSLGVALLEIAHGKPLEKFRTGTDLNLLCTAHRLVERACPLGERYRELARQCLRCDFGCGAELELRGLQDAVYTDVVRKLDELMAVLQV